jgi:hypothetical protein
MKQGKGVPVRDKVQWNEEVWGSEGMARVPIG